MNNQDIKIDDTLLLSGYPIFIEQLGLLIHQPKLIEYIVNGGEEKLNIFLRILSLEPSLEDLQKFKGIKELDIIYATIRQSDVKTKNIFTNFISIFFKDFKFEFDIINNHAVLIFKNKKNENIPPLTINNLDFLLIKKYIEIILNIKDSKQDDFNPDSEKAKEIKKKMDKARAIRNKNKKSFLFNAISSYAIDQHMFIDDICNKYTMYQFFNQFIRMNSRLSYDASLDALFAGAKDVKLPNWQGNI